MALALFACAASSGAAAEAGRRERAGLTNILSRRLQLRQTAGDFCHDSPAAVSTPPVADSSKHRDHVLLVARFDEPLDWLTTLLEQEPWINNVLVYDKGADTRSSLEAQFPSDRVRIRKLPNLGREGETLLHYIIEHYDMLPERIWSMQADPITHQPQFLELLRPGNIKKYDPVFQPLTTQFAEYARIPDYLMSREEDQMDGMVKQMWVWSSSGDIMFSNGWREGQAPNVLGVDNIMKDLQEELGVGRAEVIPKTIAMSGKKLSDTNVLIPYTMSAMFMVSKDAVRANPIEFYKKARQYLLYDDDIGRSIIAKSTSGGGMYTCEWFRQGGHRGYLLERLWQYYFTNETKKEHPVSRLAVPIQYQPKRATNLVAPASTAYYPQLSTDLKRTKTRAARNATLLLQPLMSVSEQAGSGSKPLCARQRRRAADKKRRAQTTAQTALLAPGPSGLAEALVGGEAAKAPAGYGGARDSTGGGDIPSEGVSPPSDNEPTSSECCQQTNAVLERYCHDQQPMGDLDLDHFGCAAEMGTEVSFVNEGGVTKRFTEVKSCKCDCDKQLEALRSGCNLACTALPLTCASTPPPPPPSPPPPPPPAPPPFGTSCHPVPGQCCESMLSSLQKFCFSFKPTGVAVKVPDEHHWDGGDWRAPASFDSLCEEYRPSECHSSKVGEATCARFLSFVARQYDPDICAAAMSGQCDDVCEHQCPAPPPPLFDAARLGSPDSDQKWHADQKLICSAANGLCDEQASSGVTDKVGGVRSVSGATPPTASETLGEVAADAVGGVPLATKVLGGLTDKVQALVGSAKSDLSGMSKAEKIAYAMQQIEKTKNKNAAAAASTLVAARQRATGWLLDDRPVRTAVCPAGQRNPSHDECLAAMLEAAAREGLEVRGLKRVNNGAGSDVPAGCTYSHFSRNALYNANSLGGSGTGANPGNNRYQLVCMLDAQAAQAEAEPPSIIEAASTAVSAAAAAAAAAFELAATSVSPVQAAFETPSEASAQAAAVSLNRVATAGADASDATAANLTVNGALAADAVQHGNTPHANEVADVKRWFAAGSAATAAATAAAATASTAATMAQSPDPVEEAKLMRRARDAKAKQAREQEATAKQAVQAVVKRAQAQEGGLPAAAASINAAAEAMTSSHCVAVSADTTDDWCQNACSAMKPSISCPTTLCKCESAAPASDPHVTAYAARAAEAEAQAQAEAAAEGSEAKDEAKTKEIKEKSKKNIDILRAQAKASAHGQKQNNNGNHKSLSKKQLKKLSKKKKQSKNAPRQGRYAELPAGERVKLMRRARDLKAKQVTFRHEAKAAHQIAAHSETQFRWDKAAKELADKAAEPEFKCPLVGPCDLGAGVGAGQALVRGAGVAPETEAFPAAGRPAAGANAVNGWTHPVGDRVHAPGSQGPQVQVQARGKETVDAFLEASRERNFAALKMHLHNGFAEAKRQEGEEAAAVGMDPDGGASWLKAEALDARRSTFSNRWAKAVAEAHPGASKPTGHQWRPPAATGGLPLQKREQARAASLTRAEEAQLARFRQMSEAATARRGAIKATAATEEEQEELELGTFASGSRRPLRTRGPEFQKDFRAQRRDKFSERWSKASQQQGAPTYAVDKDFEDENTQFTDENEAALTYPDVGAPASAWESFTAEVDSEAERPRIPLRERSNGFQKEFKAERRGALAERWAKASSEVGGEVGSLASESVQELQAEASEAEAQAQEMEAEAEAEAEAEVGELEAEVDAEAEAEAEAAGAKAEARTLTKAASTFGARLAINQANADAEAAAAKLVQALAEDAKAAAGLLKAEAGELEQEAPTLDGTGEPTFDVPTLTRPPEQELELAKLDASVARDVQAELTKMDAQDVQTALAASKFEHAVALDSQQAQGQQAQGQQAQQGQQAAQALEAAIGARSFAERQRAVLVAEAEPEGETQPTEQQAAMQEGYAELMSEPSAAEVALRQKRALQQKWRKAEAEGYSR